VFINTNVYQTSMPTLTQLLQELLGLMGSSNRSLLGSTTMSSVGLWAKDSLVPERLFLIVRASSKAIVCGFMPITYVLSQQCVWLSHWF